MAAKWYFPAVFGGLSLPVQPGPPIRAGGRRPLIPGTAPVPCQSSTPVRRQPPTARTARTGVRGPDAPPLRRAVTMVVAPCGVPPVRHGHGCGHAAALSVPPPHNTTLLCHLRHE